MGDWIANEIEGSKKFMQQLVQENSEMRARIAELEAALREVRTAIISNATDTLWMGTECPETIVDRIDAALQSATS